MKKNGGNQKRKRILACLCILAVTAGSLGPAKISLAAEIAPRDGFDPGQTIAEQTEQSQPESEPGKTTNPQANEPNETNPQESSQEAGQRDARLAEQSGQETAPIYSFESEKGHPQEELTTGAGEDVGPAGGERASGRGDDGMPAGAEENGEAGVNLERNPPAGSVSAESMDNTAAVETTADFGLTAVSALLMESSTGTVIYEKNADQALSPASITKIMTLILIFDALENGSIRLDDEVTVSAYAKSMGGSQVFLEEGEKQTVETMIKCIVVASGNDASVAMAEHLAGSETEFVRQMNERAKELGMTQTNFEDCCGLTDSKTHVTSARDVAVMSRELITRYPQIHQYSSIWMENITHNTAQGSSEFGLANTNKLLKQYDGCNGLKTGSTSLAKYCVSATATRGGVTLIAVIMAAQDYKIRFSEAATLLNYGFGSCKLYSDESPESLPLLPLENGVKEEFALRYGGTFSYLSTTGEDFSAITKEWIYKESIQAPVTEGDNVGSLVYKLNGTEIGRVEIQAAESVEEAGYLDYWKRLWSEFLL